MKKKLPWGEFAFLGCIVAFVIYYYTLVNGYGKRAVLWPYVLLVCTLIAVVAVLVELILESRGKGDVVSDAQTEKVDLKKIWKGLSSYVAIIGSFIVYIALLKKLGMHLCNFCLSFFLTLYFSKGKWKTALVFAALLTLAFYLVFGVALKIRLPKFKLF